VYVCTISRASNFFGYYLLLVLSVERCENERNAAIVISNLKD